MHAQRKPQSPEGRRTRPTYIGFVGAGFEDEFLGLMMPALDWGVRRCQTGRPQGQTGFPVPFFMPLLKDQGHFEDWQKCIPTTAPHPDLREKD